jgi:hypothetical protein
VGTVGKNENANRIAEREMKTVLKDVKTGLLFRNMDEWTSDLEQAAGFRDTLTALKFCQRYNLDGAAIVHVFGGGKAERVVGFFRRAARTGPIPAAVTQTQTERPETRDQEKSLS